MKKWIPLTLLIALTIGIYFWGGAHYITFESIKRNRQMILLYIDQRPLLTPLLFTLLYSIMTALSVPGGSFLSVVGGFFFGPLWGTLCIIFGATLGATAIFLIAKKAVGTTTLHKRVRPFLAKLTQGFTKNEVSYLLFLRFTPLFPFWLTNIAPAFFRTRLWTYIWTTFIGILPGSYILAQGGTGLGEVFDGGKELSIQTIFNPKVQIFLGILALFSLLSILIRRYMRRDR